MAIRVMPDLAEKNDIVAVIIMDATKRGKTTSIILVFILKIVPLTNQIIISQLTESVEKELS